MSLCKSRLTYVVLASAATAALIGLTYFLPKPSAFLSAFFDINASTYPFTIQNATWFLFFVGLGELAYRCVLVRGNRQALSASYLSERKEVFYDHSDIMEIRSKIHGKTDLLAELLDVLTIRFQISDYSVAETHQMLNSQLELMQFRLDVAYSMIRYIVWLIPTVGFIGTVVGISQTLALAGASDPKSAEFLPNLTTSLALAFDTTMVALIFSAVLVYVMHLVQGQEERMIERSGTYCLNFFINKLISKK